MRFFIIADRYEFNEVTRSIHDIKERYYQVAQALSKHRNTIDEKAFHYNKGEIHTLLFRNDVHLSLYIYIFTCFCTYNL